MLQILHGSEFQASEVCTIQNRMSEDLHYWIYLRKNFIDVPLEITSNANEIQRGTCKPIYATYHECEVDSNGVQNGCSNGNTRDMVYHYKLYNTSSQIILVQYLVLQQQHHCPINLKLKPGGCCYVAATKQIHSDDSMASFFRIEARTHTDKKIE